MQKNLKMAVPSLALVLLAACAPFAPIQNQAQSEPRIAGRWMVLHHGKTKIENLPRMPFVVFDTQKHQVSGFDGCNHFHGHYVFEGGQIKAKLASTRMACLGATESALSSTLHQLFDQGAEVISFNEVSAKVLLIRNKALGAELRLARPSH